jgi:hypothetical protein
MQDAYETPFDRYDTPVDGNGDATHVEARLVRLDTWMDRLERVVGQLEATLDRFDRMIHTMRRWMMVLTVLSAVSTALTVYLALEVWRGHGS